MLPAATNFLDPTVQPEWGLVRRLKLPIPQASATSKRYRVSSATRLSVILGFLRVLWAGYCKRKRESRDQ